jgi:hypothetical protein
MGQHYEFVSERVRVRVSESLAAELVVEGRRNATRCRIAVFLDQGSASLVT